METKKKKKKKSGLGSHFCQIWDFIPVDGARQLSKTRGWGQRERKSLTFSTPFTEISQSLHTVQ